MVETRCNGVCCGLNRVLRRQVRFSMGPHSCSEESDDPGKSAMFRLNNREKSILAAFFLR